MALRSPPASSSTFTGSLAATQVAFGSGANAIAGSANFTYSDSPPLLTVGSGVGTSILRGTANAALVASAPGLDVAQTWNNAAVVFTAAKINATNMASNASSLLLDLQVGGASQFNVNRVGALSAQGGITASSFLTATGQYLQFGVHSFIDSPVDAQFRINNNAGTLAAILTVTASDTISIGATGTGALKLGTLTATAAAPTVAAGQIGFGGTTSATATAGASITIPALAQGYIVVNIAGTTAKIPYFNA